MAAVTIRDAERYLGMVYQPGVFDCASLAVLVQHDLFGRTVSLPGAADRARGRRGQAREITRQHVAAPLSQPATGCAVLLWQDAGFGEPPFNRQWHIGTVFLHQGAVWVLHAANETQGVALKRLSDLTRQGMHLEGFYQWI
ncbi:hypothetical protein GT347_16115 [Xylophilus rhododendri]|uniref:Peptidoglycan endopeptidase n=1 Tax=Xylophilus rhododendri TaxID=2697032 RepID=A0A857J8J9_9BURK|nr:hypothetical protein [Xylophilus rhododendri]QHI99369.1 hypothetical protein GT347_16115 [Xylophilus rhododendri]